MLKSEFLEMQRQDLVTSKDEKLKYMLECFEEALKDFPSSQEIEASKTCKECYDKMEKEARKRASGSTYCFCGEPAKQFIIDYLGLTKTEKTAFVKLEDFF